MMHVCFYVSLCRCELWAAHLYHMWWCCTRQRSGEHNQKHAAAYPHKNTHLLSNLLFKCKRARGKPKLNWISSERLGVCLPAYVPASTKLSPSPFAPQPSSPYHNKTPNLLPHPFTRPLFQPHAPGQTGRDEVSRSGWEVLTGWWGDYSMMVAHLLASANPPSLPSLPSPQTARPLLSPSSLLLFQLLQTAGCSDRYTHKEPALETVEIAQIINFQN